MAIVDHFKPVEGSGFMRSIDSCAARRQFNMSMGLLVVLGAAAAATALSFRVDPRFPVAGARTRVELVVQMPQYAPQVQAAARTRQIPGG